MLLGWGILAALVTSVEAGAAERTVAFGADRFGQAMTTVPNLCMFPGQEVRLLADLIDYRGGRYFYPAERFAWRLTRSNGFYEQWSPRNSTSFGPFRRDLQTRDAVYVRLPMGAGPSARLEVGTPYDYSTTVYLVDATDSRAQCTWGPNEIYFDGNTPVPAPSPTPVPPSAPYPPTPAPNPDPGQPAPQPNPAQPCFDRCAVGSACSDGCPWGARCNYVPANPPYWRVLGCR